MTRAKQMFPEVREYFFDDDTFTDNLARVEDIAPRLGRLGLTWSCNAKANVPRKTLEGDEGQWPAPAAGRLRVRQPADPQQHEEGRAPRHRPEVLASDCRELGIKIHGTFILGLPGETPGDDRGDHPLRVRGQPADDPGLARRAVSRDVPVQAGGRERLARCATRRAGRRARRADRPAHYPHLSHTEIFHSVEMFYRRFYFRAPKIASIVSEMVRSPQMMKRRLREGVEFFQFLRERRKAA